MSIDVDPKMIVRDYWNGISEHYQLLHKIGVKDVDYGPLCPGESELNLLGDVQGKNVLELGCGGAQNCIALSRQGAFCWGVDPSIEQLKYAEKVAQMNHMDVSFSPTLSPRLKYLELSLGDGEDLFRFPNKFFDVVISTYALGFVENIDKCFMEVYRVLKSQGLFVFSWEHPMLVMIRQKDDGTLKVRRSYFDRKLFTEDDRDGFKFCQYHRTISDWFSALKRHGFIVTDILEPEPKDEKSTFKGYSLSKMRIIPGTMIIRARKQPGATVLTR